MSMSQAIIKKPLDELEELARPILRLRGEVREKIIDVARKYAPSSVGNRAGNIAINHGFVYEELTPIVLGTVALAKIKRDYADDFERIAAKKL